MIFLKQLVPLNMLEEKEKFFSDFTYNPQFIYEGPVDPQELLDFGTSQHEYRALATAILEKSYHNRNYQDLEMLKGQTVDQQYVTEKTLNFLRIHNLDRQFQILWSASFVARTSITSKELKLKLPVSFRKEEVSSMLYHEVGTHALRRKNYEKQPWYLKKSKFGFSEYLPTEEGLAALHGLLPLSFRMAHTTALNYLAADWAQQHSFVELFEKLGQYLPSEEARWKRAVRMKRGLTDTSLPGGFTKDLVYLQGLVEVWQWLQKNNFNPTDLYYGKLSYKDVETAKQLNPNFVPSLPTFYAANPESYAKNMEQIGRENLLDSLTAL